MIHYYIATYFQKGVLFLGLVNLFLSVLFFFLVLIDISWLNACKARMCQES